MATSVASETTWPQVLSRLTARADLDADQARWAMGSILSGDATSAQVAGFVVGLRTKGETPVEVGALVDAMLEHARMLDFGTRRPSPILDVVGTGGDQSHSVNISTMAALVCAASGATVVKHGNRAASSATGTADVLEALGVVIDLPPEGVVASVRETGIGFCFALVHHPAMRFAGPTRRELGVPTVFNILGPLTNPGRADAGLIGCANAALAPVVADVLARRGVRALVVRGDDGWDEVSLAGPTRVWDATDGTVRQAEVTPASLGVAPVDATLLKGAGPEHNADLVRATLAGGPAPTEQVDAIRRVVAVNAAAALVTVDAARGASTQEDLASRIVAQLPRAQEVIASGAAGELLARWATASQRLPR